MLVLFFKSSPQKSPRPGEEPAVLERMRKILLVRLKEATTPKEKERSERALEEFDNASGE
jgi:hypothetical protein